MSDLTLTGSVAPIRKFKEVLFKFVCFLAVFTACLFLFLLLWSVVRDGLEYLKPSFFNNWASSNPELAGIRACYPVICLH